MKVSILIPTHNRAALLRRTLDSVSRQRIPPGSECECVVVANACTDDTESVVAELGAAFPMPLRCTAEPRPGLGAARNRAVREAAGDVLALIDDDVDLDQGWLEALASGAAAGGADLFAGRITLWWEAVPRPTWLTPGMEMLLSCLNRGPEPIDLARPDVIGANFAFTRHAYECCGPFREDIDRIGSALLGGGETYFARAAQRRGMRIRYLPGMFVRHWVAPHRVEPPYLCAVSMGNAISILLMKQRYPLLDAARTMLIGLVRIATHALLLPFALLAGRPGAAMNSRVRMAIGRGQLLGAWRRFTSGPLR
ncbi:MAG: glycosyltransferase [Phycisphaeraceae bacterium]|nr:glycosyltransferase [Phycisphaeraceae bacterium]